MRVIEAFRDPVRAVALSPDGQLLAAATDRHRGVWNGMTNRLRSWQNSPSDSGQFAFTPDGNWLVFLSNRRLYRHCLVSGVQLPLGSPVCSGGIAVSPDGKEMVATAAGFPQEVRLQRWLLPQWREANGIDYWSPFSRLAFSPNGESIAGISLTAFELRFAHSFGLNRRERPPEQLWRSEEDRLNRWRGTQPDDQRYWDEPAIPEPSPEPAFLSFSQDRETIVFGWGPEFRVMETRAGKVLKRVETLGKPFRDVAVVGSGRYLVSVDGTPVMQMWSCDTWEPVSSYDWSVGGLTCVATSADGWIGVCGTDTGQLLLFDVDE